MERGDKVPMEVLLFSEIICEMEIPDQSATCQSVDNKKSQSLRL